MRLLSSIAVIVVVFTCSAAQAQGERESPPLRQLLAAVESDDNGDVRGVDKTARLAIEVGEAAAPHLARLLTSASDPSRRRRIAWALAYVGGSAAVAVLQAHAAASADPNAKAPLLFAMASTTASDKSIGFLIDSLKGPHYGSEWFPIVEAATSLGVLREKGAVAALEQVADKNQGFASSAAKTALQWIRGSAFKLVVESNSESDDLVTAVFEYPLAEFSRFPRLCESGQNRRLWRRTDSTWFIESGCTENVAGPTVSVDTYRSTDGARAIMAIGFVAGPLDGIGYNVVFRRRANGWAVVGINFTWVS